MKYLVLVFFLLYTTLNYAQMFRIGQINDPDLTPIEVEFPGSKLEDVKFPHMRTITPIHNFAHKGKIVYYNGYPLENSDSEKEIKVLGHKYELVSDLRTMSSSGILQSHSNVWLYVSNNGNLYHDTKIMKDANPDDFEVITNLYTKSNNNIYIDGIKIEGLQSSNFKVLTYDNHVNINGNFRHNSMYTTDDINIFYRDRKIENVDLKSFKILKNVAFSKDNKHIYYLGKKVDKISSNGYTILESLYSKNDQQVYISEDVGVDDCALDASFGSLIECDGKKYIFLEKGTGYPSLFSRKNALKLIDADPSTFKVLEEANYVYSIDKDKVFHKGNLRIGAKPSSFRIMKEDPNYALDENNLYYNGVLVENADPSTFVKMPGYGKYWNHFRDKNNIYYNGKKVEGITAADLSISLNYLKKDNTVWLRVVGGNLLELKMDADPTTFVVYTDYDNFPCPYAKDKTNIYYLGMPIKDVDVNTFQPYKSSRYAWDKNHLYFNGEIVNTDGNFNKEKFEVIDYLELDHRTDDNFRNVYATDGTKIYYNAQLLEDCVKDKFEIHMNNGTSMFAYCGEKVYCRGKLIDGAERAKDAWTPFRTAGNTPYSTDNKNVYYENKIIAKSTEYLRELNSEYAKVGKQIYFAGEEMTDVDFETFYAYSDGLYARDKNNVYYANKKIEGANLARFDVLTLGYAKDNKTVYYKGVPVRGIKPDHVRTNYGIGKAHYVYNKNTSLYKGKKYKNRNW